jgi:hypothetical protein
MLTEQDRKDFERFVNAECMTQVEDVGQAAALEGVRLALAIANGAIPFDLHYKAVQYLYTFGNWDELPLKTPEDKALIKRWLEGGNERVRAALGEMCTSAAEALASERVSTWGEGGRLGDALLGILDIAQNALKENW